MNEASPPNGIISMAVSRWKLSIPQSSKAFQNFGSDEFKWVTPACVLTNYHQMLPRFLCWSSCHWSWGCHHETDAQGFQEKALYIPVAIPLNQCTLETLHVMLRQLIHFQLNCKICKNHSQISLHVFNKIRRLLDWCHHYVGRCYCALKNIQCFLHTAFAKPINCSKSSTGVYT